MIKILITFFVGLIIFFISVFMTHEYEKKNKFLSNLWFGIAVCDVFATGIIIAIFATAH